MAKLVLFGAKCLRSCTRNQLPRFAVRQFESRFSSTPNADKTISSTQSSVTTSTPLSKVSHKEALPGESKPPPISDSTSTLPVSTKTPDDHKSEREKLPAEGIQVFTETPEKDDDFKAFVVRCNMAGHISPSWKIPFYQIWLSSFLCRLRWTYLIQRINQELDYNEFLEGAEHAFQLVFNTIQKNAPSQEEIQDLEPLLGAELYERLHAVLLKPDDDLPTDIEHSSQQTQRTDDSTSSEDGEEDDNGFISLNVDQIDTKMLRVYAHEQADGIWASVIVRFSSKLDVGLHLSKKLRLEIEESVGIQKTDMEETDVRGKEGTVESDDENIQSPLGDDWIPLPVEEMSTREDIWLFEGCISSRNPYNDLNWKITKFM